MVKDAFSLEGGRIGGVIHLIIKFSEESGWCRKLRHSFPADMIAKTIHCGE
jgi:hypothetical protein